MSGYIPISSLLDTLAYPFARVLGCQSALKIGYKTVYKFDLLFELVFPLFVAIGIIVCFNDVTIVCDNYKARYLINNFFVKLKQSNDISSQPILIGNQLATEK